MKRTTQIIVLMFSLLFSACERPSFEALDHDPSNLGHRALEGQGADHEIFFLVNGESGREIWALDDADQTALFATIPGAELEWNGLALDSKGDFYLSHNDSGAVVKLDCVQGKCLFGQTVYTPLSPTTGVWGIGIVSPSMGVDEIYAGFILGGSHVARTPVSGGLPTLWESKPLLDASLQPIIGLHGDVEQFSSAKIMTTMRNGEIAFFTLPEVNSYKSVSSALGENINGIARRLSEMQMPQVSIYTFKLDGSIYANTYDKALDKVVSSKKVASVNYNIFDAASKPFLCEPTVVDGLYDHLKSLHDKITSAHKAMYNYSLTDGDPDVLAVLKKNLDLAIQERDAWLAKMSVDCGIKPPLD